MDSRHVRKVRGPVRMITGAMAALLITASGAMAQAVTTATIVGHVTGSGGERLVNAEVTVSNAATGVSRQALTQADGRYVVTGLRPGGPYVLTVSHIGYAQGEVDGIELALGDARRVDLQLRTQAVELDAVRVTTRRPGGSETGGTQTVVTEREVRQSPSINREIVDVARFTPQAFVANEDDDGAAISIAGQNNEYNSLYIDGVVNNDVFGLSAQGTNGGQTGASPISFDAVEQIQIALSPYDVTQSGFTGGAINAITRSGTNRFEGSFYYQLRNEALAGESVWLGENAEPLPEFGAQRYGFRLGGPMVENKIFFFVNGELFRSETPAPFNSAVYEGSSLGRMDELRQALIDEVGYDPGSFGDKASSLDDNKLLVKFDWNITDNHRLSARHSYSHSDNIDEFASDADDINFRNTAEVFPNTTNSTALELNSDLGGMSNKLLVGLTFVRDDRGFAADPFPYIRIDDGAGDIQLGSERFSTGNILNQDILSVTNNLTMFMGAHTVTVGTHNEFYDIGNLFLRENFGYYEYNSVDDFLQSLRAISDPSIDPVAPRSFSRGFSLVDDVTGDESDAIGAFKAYQLGIYVQDHWEVNDRLELTGGIRVDLPKITTDPRTNDEIVNTVMPQIAQVHDLEGAVPGATPAAAPYLAPRLGFRFDALGDGSALLRGGVGVFTGRVPFVYPGAMYLNNGVTAGYVRAAGTLPNGDPIPFVADVDNALDAGDFGRDVVPSGEVDLFAENFRYPRVFRTSLGLDYALPGDFFATVEGQYTKNLDNILIENVNFRPQNDNLDGPDNRPVYNYGTLGSGLNPFANVIQSTVDPVLKVTNYSEGYTYDVTASVSRTFGENTTARVALTYGDAHSVNDATSDQIYSVWRFNENVNGLNNLDMARSDFSIGTRFLAQLTHRQELLDNLATTVSAVFTGESGRPYSWIIGNNFTFTGEGSGTSPLAYIPNSASELTWTDYTSGGTTYTATEQQAAFDAFVDNNEYLSSRRGDYAERNADRAPMEWVMDLRLAQELFANIGGNRNTVELTLDIFNFTNLINSDWGRRYNAGFRTIDLLRFEGFVDAANGDLTPIYTFRRDEENMDQYWEERVLDFGNYGSRWLMQFGARYSF